MMTTLGRNFCNVGLTCLSVFAMLPVSVSYALMPVDVEAALSTTYHNCIAETGGHTDLMQDCQASEAASLNEQMIAEIRKKAGAPVLSDNQVEWQSGLQQLCQELSTPDLMGGSADELILASCRLRQMAGRLIWLRSLADDR